MKISENTINILKNFSTINPSLLVKPGSVLSTIAPNRSIYAKAVVEENFPRQFAIYELNTFLGVLSLFKEPEFEFGDKQAKIIAGRQSVNYTYADPDTIFAPPDKTISIPTADIEFNITQEELSRLVRAAAVFKVPNIVVASRDGKIVVTATSASDPTASMFNIEVGETDKTFNMVFDTSYIIKLLAADYQVKITAKGIASFASDIVSYFIVTEASSSFVS